MSVVTIGGAVFAAPGRGGGRYRSYVQFDVVEGPGAFDLAKSTQFGGLHFAQTSVAAVLDPEVGPLTWTLKMKSNSGNVTLDPAEVDDILLVVGYEVD